METMRDIDRQWLTGPDTSYDNPDLNVYVGDLHSLMKDEQADTRDKSWAKGIITQLVNGNLAREDFLLVCRRLDNI